MPDRKETFKPELERALTDLAQRNGMEFAGQIRPVILANFRAGRVEFFLENSPASTIVDYLARVAEIYTRLNAFVTAIQIDRSTSAWGPLYTWMQKLAYSFLRRRGLIPGETTYRLGVDCATDAAITLLNARFPYDTDFEPWAFNFIRYACLKNIAKEMRQTQNILDALDLSESTNLISVSGNGRYDADLYADLSAALQKLTPNRRLVLQLRYGQGLSSRKTAGQMGNSVNAVDKLHHDAIKQLRALLINRAE